jgi:hypothetical protein
MTMQNGGLNRGIQAKAAVDNSSAAAVVKSTAHFTVRKLCVMIY